MAFAIGMDAFSISLGMGVYKIRLRKIFSIGLLVGLFHFLMPLIGLSIGHLLSGTFGTITLYIGSSLLIIIGLQMGISSFNKKEVRNAILPRGWGLLVFALLVSLDSFSAGLSLGFFGVRVIVTVVCFGIVATFLTWTGLLLGRKMQSMLGRYAELLGGIILISFGVKLLLPFPF